MLRPKKNICGGGGVGGMDIFWNHINEEIMNDHNEENAPVSKT